MGHFGIYNNRTVSSNISNRIYGDRFHSDQTLYEYLIEFLLIFLSSKSKENEYKDGKMSFHNDSLDLRYYAERKIGLKRFIFYTASKKDTSIRYDKEAYEYMLKSIEAKIDRNKDEAQKIIAYLQDLLRGYAVVLKKRSWCAQQTLPICPELVFCEAMPNQKKRKEKVNSGREIQVDSSFEFAQRNFLARGGELYYLHILKSLLSNKTSEKQKLEKLLTNLLTEQSSKISQIARFIQDTWTESLNLSDYEKNELYQEYTLAWIPEDAYGQVGDYAVDELINYLSASMQQIKKIEILAEGIMLQILRMLHTGACNQTQTKPKPWIIDMSRGESSDIKKLSSLSFRNVEDDFKSAINDAARDLDDTEENMVKIIRAAQKESLDIFRSKGKEIRCIIPISGPFERFTLSENVLRFLVMSIIKPGEKMTLDSFVEELYKHFNIVIGPKQYKKSLPSNADNSQISQANYLDKNILYLQNYLNSIGCLKELSDATSIVVNSYSLVNMEVEQ